MKKGIINQFDSERRQHGYWEHRFTNGSLYKKGNYVHGEMNGVFTFYYYSGDNELLRVRMKCEFKRGVRSGFTIVYLANADIGFLGFKKDNKDIGLWYEKKYD